MPIILGIESSCDDTSAAVCIDGKICSNSIASQAIHQYYGGVVPELASRAHQQNIIPTVQRAIDIANIRKNDVNAVAFTRGPGLLGSLLVGTCFAKAFALAKQIPLIEVNHMQAHILAHFIVINKVLNTTAVTICSKPSEQNLSLSTLMLKHYICNPLKYFETSSCTTI